MLTDSLWTDEYKKEAPLSGLLNHVIYELSLFDQRKPAIFLNCSNSASEILISL